jgi:hypothetical protein
LFLVAIHGTLVPLTGIGHKRHAKVKRYGRKTANVPPKPNNRCLNMEKNTKILWLRRLGVGGFLFFLIKGLLWIALFYGGFQACK